MFDQPSRPNPIIRKIHSGKEVLVYVMGNFASPRHVDFVCRSGLFDALWFDLEHFDIPTQELAVLNMVARGYDIGTIARIKASDYQTVMRTLETGVDGIMCAMVADANDARNIVNWARFNNPTPVSGETTGSRGWNGGNIDAAYGNFPAQAYMRHQNTETIVLCQIEHEAALAQAGKIAAVPGVDGLFFGPGDYAAGLGLAGQIAHPRVKEGMAGVAAAAKTNSKWWGTVAPGMELYTAARDLGGLFLCPGGDVKVMNLGIRKLWESVRGEASPAKSSSEKPKYP